MPGDAACFVHATAPLTTWNDDRGFGFIMPDEGGAQVVAHISAYSGRGRPCGRRQVTSRFERNSAGLTAKWAPGAWLAGLIVLLVAAGLWIAFARAWVPVGLLAVYAVASVLAFVSYGIDKRAAVTGQRRIPENRLHLFEVAGGWPGALLAQQVFRHKTRKVSYQIVFWLTVVVNVGLLGWLLMAPDASTLRHQLGFSVLPVAVVHDG